MKVSVAGTGYVGLVSGACLADIGHEVICVDIDQSKVDAINRAETPIYESGLEELLGRNIGSRLVATTNLRQAVLDSELTLIAVGTPFDGERIDLTYVKNVAAEIGEALRDKNSYHTVVVKSTVVPGTTDEIVLPILEQSSGKKAGKDFGLGMNPEFLKEGEAIKDFMEPDRIVFGGIDYRSAERLNELYAGFDKAEKMVVNCRTAEMIKYTANSLLATLISFSNEIANLCTASGNIDVTEVMAGVHLDKRLSPILKDGERITPAITTYIEAGCGFGGSCFPKDVKALVAYGKTLGSPMSLLNSVVEINLNQPHRMLEILDRNFPDCRDLKAAVLGLSFKPGSDDMRESPAIPIVRELAGRNIEMKAFDPVAEDEARKIFTDLDISYVDDLETAVEGVDVIFLITRWPEFGKLPEIIDRLDQKPLLIDGRRLIDRNEVERYAGIGM